MAEQLRNTFIDFGKKLQSYLDEIEENLFVVSNEKNLDAKLSSKVYVVVSALTSNDITENSAAITYKLSIFTTKSPDDVIGVFTGLAQKKNKTFYMENIEVEEGVIKECTVFEKFGTPAVFNPDAQLGDNNHWTELVAFANVLVLFEIGNIKSIKVNGGEVDFLIGSFNYNAELPSFRQTGRNLNKSFKRSAATTIQLKLINRLNVFTKQLLDITFGKLDGNSIFNFDIELTNGYKVEQLPCIVSTNVLNFARTTPTLPTIDVIFALAESATDDEDDE